MTRRQFWLNLLAILLVGLAIGPASYFAYQSTRASYERDVRLEQEQTQRTRERWEAADRMLKRLPFVD